MALLKYKYFFLEKQKIILLSLGKCITCISNQDCSGRQFRLFSEKIIPKLQQLHT
jgi:hypothetical protein